jgi:hypothetical protein
MTHTTKGRPRPDVKSKVTIAQLQAALAALAAGVGNTRAAASIGISTQQLWNLRVGKTLRLADGLNPLNSTRRAA